MLPGMLTEVDKVLQGLGLPLDLVKQKDPELMTLDPATRRLLNFIENEKNEAVQQEKFENASNLNQTMNSLQGIGAKMLALQKEKEYAVLRGDYKAAAHAKREMNELDKARKEISSSSPGRSSALMGNTQAWGTDSGTANLATWNNEVQPGRPTSSSSADTDSPLKRQRETRVAERRVDENDGRLYSKSEFRAKYGGLKEWKHSLSVDQIRGQDRKKHEQNKKEIARKAALAAQRKQKEEEEEQIRMKKEAEEAEIRKKKEEEEAERKKRLEELSPEEKEVKTLLVTLRLEKFLETFLAEGVGEVDDLKDLDEEDVEELGMNMIEKKRFLRWQSGEPTAAEKERVELEALRKKAEEDSQQLAALKQAQEEAEAALAKKEEADSGDDEFRKKSKKIRKKKKTKKKKKEKEKEKEPQKNTEAEEEED
eukprot:g2087.t1